MANDYGWFSQLEHLNIVVIIVLSIMAIIFAIGSIVISIMALVYCVQDSEKVRTNMDQILKNTCLKHKSYQIISIYCITSWSTCSAVFILYGLISYMG